MPASRNCAGSNRACPPHWVNVVLRPPHGLGDLERPLPPGMGDLIDPPQVQLRIHQDLCIDAKMISQYPETVGQKSGQDSVGRPMADSKTDMVFR